MAAPNGLVGDWRGTWIKGGDALPVTLTIAVGPEGFTGKFSSDALQVADIPLGHISETGEKIHFDVQGDDGSTIFDGTLSRDHLSGEFIDHEHNDAHGRFDLLRASHAEPVLKTREVTFADGAVVLSGTLILPVTPGRHRAVLFLQGSGPEGRWANRYLAQAFAKAGVAALIYDKRGVGQSTGDWRTAGFEALAQDAAAGVRFLRAQAEVEPRHVGVYGHSQGGTIAPLVSQWSNGLDFIIASAAGGLDPAEVETYSVGNSMGLSQLAPSERKDAEAYLREVISVAYRGGDRAALDAMAMTYKDRPWFFAPPPPENGYWSISRQIASFKPAESWQHVQARVLLVYGGRDERVPPRSSAAAIASALAAGGQPKPAVIFYPNADHLFVLPSSAKVGWPRRQPGYADKLIAWILQLP